MPILAKLAYIFPSYADLTMSLKYLKSSGVAKERLCVPVVLVALKLPALEKLLPSTLYCISRSFTDETKVCL